MLLLRYLPVLNDQSEVEFPLIPISAHAWLSKAPSKALVDIPDPSTHVHGTMQTRPSSIPISFTYHLSHFPNSHIYHVTTNPLIIIHISHTRHHTYHPSFIPYTCHTYSSLYLQPCSCLPSQTTARFPCVHNHHARVTLNPSLSPPFKSLFCHI